MPLEHKGKSILFEVSHDHIIKPDFVVKNGKISGKPAGFHCDPGGSLQKLGLIQSHGLKNRGLGLNNGLRTSLFGSFFPKRVFLFFGFFEIFLQER